MAGLGNRRGSKTSSGSRSARDRVSAAREKIGGGSRRSRPSDAYKEYGPGKREGKRGGKLVAGSKPKKGGYILTESVDNLIGGKFTKKSGPRRATREEVLEARKKRQEQKSGTGPRRVRREGANEEIRKAYRDKVIEARKKKEEKNGKRLRPGGTREDVAPKRPVRVGIGGKGGAQAGGNQIDKVRGPKKGGVIGGSGRDLTKGRPGGNQIDKVRGPKSGVGPKRRPTGGNQNIGQTGGNVGPGGKGPNRTGGRGPKAGIGQGGKRRSSQGLKQAANSDYDFIV